MHPFHLRRCIWLLWGLLAAVAMTGVGAAAENTGSTAGKGVAQASGTLELSRDGASDYIIVLPPEASAVEQTAARELAEHLAQVTGVTLPIASSDEVPAGRPRIVLGDGPLTRQLLPGFDAARLGPDAIVIKSVGRDLVLAGHTRRGTLYAVFTFLEDMLACAGGLPPSFTFPTGRH